jgi:hypothetical protein
VKKWSQAAVLSWYFQFHAFFPEEIKMKTWLRSLCQKKSLKKQTRRTARPQLEGLEDRQVPTVTFHGGALLANVEVQALYYGSDWSTNSTLAAQRAQLDAFLNYTVQSPYMLMLNNAAYGVGNGTFNPGVLDAITLTPNSTITDGQLQNALQGVIATGNLQAPDSNRLYVIFVQDNVAVQRSDGSTSRVNFRGYHSAFLDTFPTPYLDHDIHYVVVPYPGGSVGNTTVPGLGVLNSLTLTTARELADAVTDPDFNYKATGWREDALGADIGDLPPQAGMGDQIVYLNSYAVQRIADQHDQAMTPWSVGAAQPVNFALLGNNWLWERTSAAGWSIVATNAASVSDQGIDNHGQAMVDYVTTNGNAYEFHDGSSSSVFLASGVAQAKAGQGVSYVLFNKDSQNITWVKEFNDAGNSWRTVLAYNGGTGAGIRQIDTGTDKYGVNAVDLLYTSGVAGMQSDTDGWHYLMSNVKQVSGGQMGYAILLDTSGNAYTYNEWVGSPTFLTGSVAQVTTGSDQTGNITFGVVYNSGPAYEYRPASNQWTYVATSVQALSKERLGLVDVLFTSGYAETFDSSGLHFLFNSVTAVA